MDEDRARRLIEAVIAGSNTLYEIAATALRNRKRLSGDTYYAEKFHDGVVKFTRLRTALDELTKNIDGFDASELTEHLQTVSSEMPSASDRDSARKQIR